MRRLFTRSRVTFYSAEGLKELARDQMADSAFFETFRQHFADGLFHTYTKDWPSGLSRLQATVQAAQSLPLEGHVLTPHATPNDREGVCHHLANNGDIVVAGINDEEATVKTFRRRGERVVLVPANPEYAEIEMSADELTIYGKVVTVLRRL